MDRIEGSAFKNLTGKPPGKSPLGRLRVGGRTILENILKKQMSLRGTGLIRYRKGMIGESYRLRHCISGFHKPWSQLVQERDLQGALGVGERTILEWILKIYVSIRGIRFNRLRNRYYWTVLVNGALNLGFHKPWGWLVFHITHIWFHASCSHFQRFREKYFNRTKMSVFFKKKKIEILDFKAII